MYVVTFNIISLVVIVLFSNIVMIIGNGNLVPSEYCLLWMVYILVIGGALVPR